MPLQDRPHWWVVLVKYPKEDWEPIALFKFEVEAIAYVDRHNSHHQAGKLYKIPLSALVASVAETAMASLVVASERLDLLDPPKVTDRQDHLNL